MVTDRYQLLRHTLSALEPSGGKLGLLLKTMAVVQVTAMRHQLTRLIRVVKSMQFKRWQTKRSWTK